MQSVLLNKQIVKILEWIVEEEGIKLSRESIKKIILRSKNNLRQAIRSLEATYRHKWVIIYMSLFVKSIKILNEISENNKRWVSVTQWMNY
jgi:DNA polymerase III delta prime subunit